jgi:iron complex transport system substrate-binding protein
MNPNHEGKNVSKRIVSLIPSSTEIVYELGFGDQLVGRSHECDYPANVTTLPICTESKLDLKGTSQQIDQRVKTVLQESLSVYRVYGEVLKSLQPDVIITQTQCEVCAVSFNDVERAACEWLDKPANIVALEPNALADVFADIQRVADALGVPETGAAKIAEMQARMAAIAERAQPLSQKPTIACVEWIDPLMAAGNWMPELVEMAGGVNLFGEAGKHSPWMTWEELHAKDPDVIVMLPCGYDMERTLGELSILSSKPGWNHLRAVEDQQVYVTDGNQYFNRPGPRLVESLEILAEILHPEVFHFGHEGRGWQRL